MVNRWPTAGLAGLLMMAGIAWAEDPGGYPVLSERIKQAVVEKAPKRFEDRSAWGQTVPIPPLLRFPRLERTVVRVDGHDEFPDGVWKRSLVWLDDPAKDIQVRVFEVKQKDANTYGVKLSATVALHGERERQRWRNGVRLFEVTAQADARIAAEFDCDVAVRLDTTQLPPDVIVSPKVVASRLELKDFALNRVGNVVVGEQARALGDELKDVLQDLLRQREDDVKEYANRAIARALQDGKGRIPVTELLKMKARANEAK